MKDCSWIPGVFENAAQGNFDVVSDCTSDRTPNYNCIAWAAGETNTPWWPTADPLAPYYWPFLNDEETLENFVRAFETLGYQDCTPDDSIEDGFEKVAIYADAKDVPLHAAKSLPNGKWSSKMGNLEDIEHATLGVVAGKHYGHPKRFLKKSR
jgi:hypothetical protein